MTNTLHRDEIWVEGFLDVVEEIVVDSYLEISSHMKDELPNECVGLLWMDGTSQRLINQARSPKRFSISTPQLMERLSEVDETNVLICVYHSHPGGNTSLSWDDKRSLKRQWSRDLIVPWLVVTDSAAVLWYLVEEEQELFVSRSLNGVMDD